MRCSCYFQKWWLKYLTSYIFFILYFIMFVLLRTNFLGLIYNFGFLNILHVYIINFGHFHLQLTALISLPDPLHPLFIPTRASRHFHVSCDPLNLISISYMRMGMELCTGAWERCQWLFHWIKWLPFSQHPLAASSSSRRSEASWAPPAKG